MGSNFTISVSCHHFGWAFPSSGKSRIDQGRPIAFKTRFFNFSHRGETKKHHWDRILQFRFHATILGGLFQAAEKTGFTKVVQLRSKRVFSTFPIGAKLKNTLGIEFYNFGFMPPFCVGFSKQRKKPGVRRSSNCVQNAFFQLSPSGRNEKTPLGSNFTISVSCHHFGWAFPSSGKSRVDEGRPIRSKRVLCALCTVHYTRYTLLCALYTVHCTLCTMHYTRYTVLCALCTIHGALYSVHCALYTVHCTLCAVHYTPYTVQCTVYSAQHTEYSVPCIVHSAQSTVHRV